MHLTSVVRINTLAGRPDRLCHPPQRRSHGLVSDFTFVGEHLLLVIAFEGGRGEPSNLEGTGLTIPAFRVPAMHTCSLAPG